jgi:hypothetical protein
VSDPGRRNSEPQEPPKKLEDTTSLELLRMLGELDPEPTPDPTRPPEIPAQAAHIVTLGYSTAPQEENPLF